MLTGRQQPSMPQGPLAYKAQIPVMCLTPYLQGQVWQAWFSLSACGLLDKRLHQDVSSRKCRRYCMCIGFSIAANLRSYQLPLQLIHLSVQGGCCGAHEG